jgi:tetratricopeptide (TPR) repeat protein
MDMWDRTQRSWERQIDALDKAGDAEAANQQRREYAGQQAAWRAQQNVNALAPREVRPEGGTSLPQVQLDQLQRLLTEALRLNPSALTGEDYFRRATSHHLAGRPQEALDDLNRALELKPDHPSTLNNRGLALRSLERYKEALADFNRALELRPGDPDALNNRGVALVSLGRHQEALADYNRALELSSDNPRTLYNLACLFSQTQRYQEALDWLARAMIVDPKYRSMAAQDPDFAPALGHPQFGPQFRLLVGGEGATP